MRKFTLLMMSLLCAMTAWAGPTDLPQMSTDGDIKVYTIKKASANKYVTYADDNVANALLDEGAVSYAS